MARKTVNKQSSTDNDAQAINPKTIQRLKNTDFNCSYSWRERPVSDEFIESMARELEDWVIDEKNNLRPYAFTNFTRPRRLRRDILNEWADKNEVFRKAFAFAKEAIASRRYDLRVEHRFDEKQFYIDQGKYDPEFDADFKKYNEAIKASQLDKDETDKKITVEVIRK